MVIRLHDFSCPNKKIRNGAKMMRKRINISLPEETLAFIRDRSRECYFSSASEYIRSLVRQDQLKVRKPKRRALRTANDCMNPKLDRVL